MPKYKIHFFTQYLVFSGSKNYLVSQWVAVHDLPVYCSSSLASQYRGVSTIIATLTVERGIIASQEDKASSDFTSLTGTTEAFTCAQVLHTLGIASIDLDRGIDHTGTVVELASIRQKIES